MKTRKIKQKLLAVMLVLCLAIGLLPMTAFAAETETDVWDGTVANGFAGGDGSAENPYQIATGAQLAYLSQLCENGSAVTDKQWILTADIDLNNHPWTPIGDLNTGYPSGNFDGQGHTVSGLNVSVTNVEHYYDGFGLFGVFMGTIQNLAVSGRIEGVEDSVNEIPAIGGLCGLIAGEVNNCRSEVDITLTGQLNAPEIGGVIGSAQPGTTIQNCIYTRALEYRASGKMGNSSTGGIVGKSYGEFIINSCKNEGQIKGYCGFIGGIVGYVEEDYTDTDSQNVIANCMNTGMIELSETPGNSWRSLGGIVGDLTNYKTDLGSTLLLVNCLNYGQVNYSGGGNNKYIGPVYGSKTDAEVRNCYYVWDVSAPPEIGITQDKQVNQVAETAVNTSEFLRQIANNDHYPNSTDFWMLSDEGKLGLTFEFPLSAPQNLIWNEDTTGSVSWDPVNRASGYLVQLYKNGSPVGEAVAVTEPAYTVSITEPGSYTFGVKAFNGQMESAEAVSDGLNFYTLSFETNGGDAIKPLLEREGKAIDLRKYVPERSGYRFAGWYADASLAQPITSISLNGDQTVYAGWEKTATTIYYALHFETNGGNEIQSRVEKSGTTIDLAEYIPVRDDYTFTGWYADKDLTEKIDEVKLDQTKTVYAGWEKDGPVVDPKKDQAIYMKVAAQERDLKNGSRTTKSKVCTLKLGFAVDDPDLDLAYTTSDPEVATVKDGKITYQGVGSCVITVTAKETALCKAASRNIEVVVGKLGTPTFTPSVTANTAAKAFVATSSTVRGVDGWEVQYSIRDDWWRATTKDFPNTGTKLYRKTCTTVHSDRTYYIRVRGYQIIDGENVYSDWSPAKTIRTK